MFQLCMFHSCLADDGKIPDKKRDNQTPIVGKGRSTIRRPRCWFLRKLLTHKSANTYSDLCKGGRLFAHFPVPPLARHGSTPGREGWNQSVTVPPLSFALEVCLYFALDWRPRSQRGKCNRLGQQALPFDVTPSVALTLKCSLIAR